jgi:hypothetical protein
MPLSPEISRLRDAAEAAEAAHAEEQKFFAEAAAAHAASDTDGCRAVRAVDALTTTWLRLQEAAKLWTDARHALEAALADEATQESAA